MLVQREQTGKAHTTLNSIRQHYLQHRIRGEMFGLYIKKL